MGYKTGRALMKGKCLVDAIMGTQEEAREAERILGYHMAEELLRTLLPLEENEQLAAVAASGDRLAGRLTDKQFAFQFRAVQAGAPNAFALPGGHVFVNAALLALCEGHPDELAFVLAHEIAHVVNGHVVDRVVTDSLLTTLVRTLGPRNAVGTWLGKVGTRALTSAYSRANEDEADLFAVRLSRAAGFTPAAGADLMLKLEALKSRGEQSGLGEYFSSHPPLKERALVIRRAARDEAERGRKRQR